MRAMAAFGLCDSCRHQRLVRTGRGSVFTMCLKSREDPAFPKYPRVPVEQCAGYLRRRARALPSATMAAETKTTTDHDAIRAWVESHHGRPARVRGTGDGDDPGVLRIDFPGGAGEDELEPIAWDEWFEKFEASNLAVLSQERKASGEDSTFFKLVNRDDG